MSWSQAQKKYYFSEKGRAAQKRYRMSEAGIAARKRYYEKKKAKKAEERVVNILSINTKTTEKQVKEKRKKKS